MSHFACELALDDSEWQSLVTLWVPVPGRQEASYCHLFDFVWPSSEFRFEDSRIRRRSRRGGSLILQRCPRSVSGRQLAINENCEFQNVECQRLSD
jgi:hypothetical protein